MRSFPVHHLVYSWHLCCFWLTYFLCITVTNIFNDISLYIFNALSSIKWRNIFICLGFQSLLAGTLQAVIIFYFFFWFYCWIQLFHDTKQCFHSEIVLFKSSALEQNWMYSQCNAVKVKAVQVYDLLKPGTLSHSCCIKLLLCRQEWGSGRWCCLAAVCCITFSGQTDLRLYCVTAEQR